MVSAGSAEVTTRVIEAPSEVVWNGVSALLDSYASVSQDDSVVVFYAEDAKEPAAWITAELRLRGIDVRLQDLDAYTERTISEYADRARTVLRRPDEIAGRLIVFIVEFDSVVPSEWFRTVLQPYQLDRVAVYRLIKAGTEFFEQALTVSPEQLDQINAGLLNRLRTAEQLRITTSAGTDLRVDLSPSTYTWVSNRGKWRKGAFVFLPAGEVATYPSNINGVLVADGAFNTNAATEFDARIGDYPVTVEIEEGRMVGYQCADSTMTKLIERCLTFANFDRVGELGIGTNVGIHKYVRLNSHLNERWPGLHIGFGQHNQGHRVAYRTPIHLDLICSDITISLPSGERIHSSQFGELTGVHPEIELGVYDEDLDGDCCGLFSAISAE